MSDRSAVTANFVGRQTRQAGEATARVFKLAPGCAVFVRQNPAAIDASVFHNDVIAVNHDDLLLYHEHAFVRETEFIDELTKNARRELGLSLRAIRISETELPLSEAVATYFFNSQIVTLPDGKRAMIFPRECETSRTAFDELTSILRLGAIYPFQR